MDSVDAEQLTALLQAHTIALTALLATHPQPDLLRSAFETMAIAAPHQNVMFLATVETLRRAIPPH